MPWHTHWRKHLTHTQKELGSKILLSSFFTEWRFFQTASSSLAHRRNNAELLQHPQGVDVEPMLDALAALEAVDIDPRHRHLFVGWGIPINSP